MKQNLKVFGELPAIIFKNKGLTLSIGNRKKFLFKTKGKYKAAFILFYFVILIKTYLIFLQKVFH